MTIKYSKKFRKQFQKLRTPEQEQFWERLEWFKVDPHDPRLSNHTLKGTLRRYNSINIAGDLRALYEFDGTEVYLYDMIGSHSQLYS